MLLLWLPSVLQYAKTEHVSVAFGRCCRANGAQRTPLVSRQVPKQTRSSKQVSKANESIVAACARRKLWPAGSTAGAVRRSPTRTPDAVPQRAAPRRIQTKGQLQAVLGCTRERDRDRTS